MYLTSQLIIQVTFIIRGFTSLSCGASMSNSRSRQKQLRMAAEFGAQFPTILTQSCRFLTHLHSGQCSVHFLFLGHFNICGVFQEKKNRV
jgi:hypothetical protein